MKTDIGGTTAPTPASGAAGEEDFDMFAQSRQSFDQSRQTANRSDTFTLICFISYYQIMIVLSCSH